MPISENIVERVNNTDASEAEKTLMMEILRIEDKGAFRFEQDYEKAIKAYLAAKDGET